MRNFIDTIFGPVLEWLNGISDAMRDLSLPVARPLDPNRYFGYFSFLGPNWVTLITTIMTLGFIYLLVYFIVNNMGLLIKFKDMIKWW